MSTWTFLTHPGGVLAVIGQQNQITAREISNRLGITERYVRMIIKDLKTEGYIEKSREGRVNRYRVMAGLPLRRQPQRDVAVGELLKVISRPPV